MRYKDFMLFNVIGAFTWVFGFVLLGYFFGNLPGIKDNIEYAIFGLVGFSLLPVILEFIHIKFKKHKE